MTSAMKYLLAALVAGVIAAGVFVAFRAPRVHPQPAGVVPPVAAPTIQPAAKTGVPPVAELHGAGDNASPAVAECETRKPAAAPVIPDGATASVEEMQTGRTEVQLYVNALEAYQACLNQRLDQAPTVVAVERKQAWQRDSDAAVDEAHALADAFSVQLKAFKARPHTP